MRWEPLAAGTVRRSRETSARSHRKAAPETLRGGGFARGSMGPKVEAACRFVEQTGRVAGVGRLEDGPAILAGRAGALVRHAARAA